MPSRLNGPILKSDLLNPDHLKFVKDLINNDACVYVHFAPPCGTASRARLIQDGDKSVPPPLRNDYYPNGLRWLTKDQQERVGKANELYRITCELILLCQSFFGLVKTQADPLCGKQSLSLNYPQHPLLLSHSFPTTISWSQLDANHEIVSRGCTWSGV